MNLLKIGNGIIILIQETFPGAPGKLSFNLLFYLVSLSANQAVLILFNSCDVLSFALLVALPPSS